MVPTASIADDGQSVESPPMDFSRLRRRYADVRTASERLCEPLTPEDCCVQSMPDASPAKWHLAHTTWFFATFLLERFSRGDLPQHPEYRVLFNSYYNGVGAQFIRSRRGILSRPSMDEVRDFRREIDEHVLALFDQNSSDVQEWLPIVEIGLQHEQQHQELLLTDVKHAFASNPLRPVYRPVESPPAQANDLTWIDCEGGLVSIGHSGTGFAFDNESPAHDVHLRPFRLATRLTTNGEFLQFVNDEGYRRPEFWLSDGWDAVHREDWCSPLYWEQVDGEWRQFTLSGMRPVDWNEPVCHVSYFEADAFARWSDSRLPTEQEWESAAGNTPCGENFVEAGRFHPAGTNNHSRSLRQMFGDVWEWTASPYIAYPGYRPLPAALGEYNGKFMCNQFVLRGGSCATPQSHIRPTYRNFFQPEKRWQFSGIRLAQDV